MGSIGCHGSIFLPSASYACAHARMRITVNLYYSSQLTQIDPFSFQPIVFSCFFSIELTLKIDPNPQQIHPASNSGKFPELGKGSSQESDVIAKGCGTRNLRKFFTNDFATSRREVTPDLKGISLKVAILDLTRSGNPMGNSHRVATAGFARSADHGGISPMVTAIICYVIPIAAFRHQKSAAFQLGEFPLIDSETEPTRHATCASRRVVKNFPLFAENSAARLRAKKKTLLRCRRSGRDVSFVISVCTIAKARCARSSSAVAVRCFSNSRRHSLSNLRNSAVQLCLLNCKTIRLSEKILKSKTIGADHGR